MLQVRPAILLVSAPFTVQSGLILTVPGRRWGMFFGALIIVIGACIQAPSVNLGMFMAGRFILGFGVAISASAGPAYVSEMAHPAYRGTMTGIYNTFYFIGGIPGTFVPYGTSYITGTNSWRIPIWLQMVFSGVVLVFSLLLPETPRWLMANDRHEEALNVITKYHGEGKLITLRNLMWSLLTITGDRESPIVQLEFKEMLEDISITGADKRWWDYRELFSSSEVRYRTMLVMAVGFFGQVCTPSLCAFSTRYFMITKMSLLLVVRKRPCNLLLSSNARRSWYKQQPLPTLPPRHAKLRLLRRRRYRRNLHRSMGTPTSTPCQYRHHHHPLRCFNSP